MKSNNHVLLLCILQVELRRGNTYAFDFIAKLLRSYGFARPSWLVRQLIKWPLLHGPLDALALLEDPLARVNPAESQPLLEKLQRVAGDALIAADSSVAPAATTPSHKFSLYAGPISNTTPHVTINLYRLWRQIVRPKPRLQAMLAEVRAKYAPKGKNEAYCRAKSQLPYVTFAGVFTKRNAAGLECPSGLGVLDYDHFPDVKKLRAELINNEECRNMLALVFVSPSGRGLKLVVRLPEDAPDYATGLRTVHEWLKRHYPVLGEFHDSAGLDIARACFLSYDPDAWLHDDFMPKGE
ncbi:BT4734/BF3469 family protein [Hymenobacter armeniacus]|uniref:BT4734-like N-terminal domain-containing protein n=1 Tax=Hymenobacter armeniacus TaxID=2771358 RepID=A0ABR8JTE4_9BACT|nr:BT4734/BF3469 family protein [Hymenobacter armeniacus]MBD2722203.1 hypothetical protein [Hymenobacter armeniacus]